MSPRPRQRPVVSTCGHLVHGIVRADNSDSDARPLVAATVHVEMDGELVAMAPTRRDGSYSVVIDSCHGQRRRTEQVILRVERTAPCEQINATRILRVATSRSDDDAVLWREDVVVRASEIVSLCEVAIERPRDQERAEWSLFKSEQQAKEFVSVGGVVISLLWGFILLWAIAKWATVNEPRRPICISDCEDFVSETHSVVSEWEDGGSVQIDKRDKLTANKMMLTGPREARPHMARARPSGKRIIRLIEDDEE